MVRATAANAQIRAFACTTRETVETARASHNTSPVVTAALGRLLSAGAMMGSMLKGDDELITLQIKGDGPIGGLTVTADMNGHVKGYANVPDVILPANAQGKLDVGGAVGAGVLSVIRDMGLKDPYVGQIELQTGEIAEDLTYYFAVSEQVPSVVGLGVLMNRDNTVRQAGGFIVHALCGRGNDQQTGREYQESLFRYYYAGCRQDSGGNAGSTAFRNGSGDHRYTSCGICLQLQQGQSEKSTDQHWQGRIAVHDR